MRTKIDFADSYPILTALALSLGAAISLGMARFSYALLLPPMRSDLGWTYLQAGSMNTANALGYFIGALATPALMRRIGAQHTLLAGAALTALFMIWCNFLIDDNTLMAQRLLAGITSALIFISGGLLAARLGTRHAQRAGLLIGLYYGGTGIGIVLSALLVPAAMAYAHSHGYAHGWQTAWLVLGLTCLVAAIAMIRLIHDIDGTTVTPAEHERFAWRAFGFGLTSYFLFGVGYIGYMTFVIALLKEQGMSGGAITAFYSALGLALVASSRVWAGLLDRYKGGQAMAILNALLCVATILPVLSANTASVFISGIMFGGVFLSVVASTTALVRHNAPAAAWPAGISLFTIVFAFGQIVGPSLVGWVSDQSGGLRHGLACSAVVLLVGALLATRQRALDHEP